MSRRLLIISAGILTGIFLATSLRAETQTPKLAELEEFRAVLNNMVQIALPQNDFDYIGARKARVKTARNRVGKLKLPDSLKHREEDFKKARNFFMKTSGRFIDVMKSDKYDRIRQRLLKVDTAFALMYVSLGGPPAAVDEFTTAAAPLSGDKKHPPRIPPEKKDLAALRRAVENLLNTKIGGDYRIVRREFDRECEMAVQAVRALGPTVAEGDSVKIDAAMRGVAASSRRMATIFEPRKK